jgi:CRP/FNR family transcriptional regulator, cyclic AMP receptor protein
MNAFSVELLGYLATIVSIFVYVSNTMIPLRVAAVIANFLFAIYFYFKGIYPQCALNAALLPLNLYRLHQMRTLIAAIKRASREDFDFEWLRPFMKPRKLGAGKMLYRQGDEATEAFVIVRGAIRVPEKSVVLEQGALFGEFGLFVEGNKRTASAEVVGEVDLLAISYSDVLQLSAQNPTFGFYLMRLMMRRMQHNVELAAQGAAPARQTWPPTESPGV